LIARNAREPVAAFALIKPPKKFIWKNLLLTGDIVARVLLTSITEEIKATLALLEEKH